MNNAKSIPILPVLTVNFIGVLGYSIIIPFLVFLVTRFGGNEFVYGLMGAVYPAFQFFGAPILGKWSDQIGRRKILVVSQAGTLIAWGLFLMALIIPIVNIIDIDSAVLGSFTLTIPLVILFFARALDGLTGGNISVANAYLSDISTDDNRKANFGKMAMSSSLGFIIGPAIAGVLGATFLEERLPVMAAMLISMVALYLIVKRLPESKQDLVEPDNKLFKMRKLFQADNRDCYEVRNCPETGIKAVFKIQFVPMMIVIYFLVFLGFSFFYAGFPMHAMRTLSWNSFQLGIFFSFLSGLMIIFQGPVLTYLSDKVSDSALVIGGTFLLIINFYMMSLASPWMTYLAAFLFAAGNGIMWPSFLSMLSKMGGEKKQGTVQGVANSAGSLASIFGMVLGGFLYSLWQGNTFLICAIVLTIVMIFSLKLISIEKSLAK